LRGCQVEPDPVLIYATPDAETLRLMRRGAHRAAGSS